MAARALLLLALVVIAAEGLPDSLYNKFLPYDGTGASSRGSDFIVAFLPNIRDEANKSPLLQLLVSTDEPEPVTFTVSLNENLPAEMREGFPLTDTVSYGEVKKITLHEDMAPVTSAAGTNGIERSKAIRVQTEGGKKVSVYGFNDDIRTTDGFMAFSCDGMRNSVFNRYEYVVLSGDQRAGEDDTKKSSLFLIVPCDDATVIRVEPSQLLTLDGLADLPRPPSATQVGPSATTTSTFNANAGQTILIKHPNDLSGSIIRGSGPLVVMGGHECGEVPLDVTACDHLVEQMPPGLALGRTFFLVPIAPRVSGDQFRVSTLTENTQVTVTCVTLPGDEPKPLTLQSEGRIDRGGLLVFMTPGNSGNVAGWKPNYCCLDATEPVIVAQYSTGYSSDSGLIGKPATEVGDPFMSIIPPVTQFMNNYTMTSLAGASGPFPFRYVNLAITSDFFDNSVSDRQQVRVDGSAASPIDAWIPFYCSNKEICGYGAQVEVNEGTINVYHEQPAVGLSASYYAYQQQNSYGFPQGFELTPISATRGILEDITVQESVGTFTIFIQRNGDLSLRSEGTFTPRSTTPEEARVGSDYMDFGPVRLLYRGGNRREEVFAVEVTILDDSIAEPTERFEISAVGTRNMIFPISIMTVTILDDDGAPTPSVFFDPASYTVNENAGTATLTIRTDVPGGPVDGAVEFYTEDGSAIAPGDFTAVPSSGAIPVNFGADQSSTTVTVSIQNDNRMEPDETFFGKLRDTGSGDVRVTQDTAEVIIVNDDVEAATVSISQQTYEVFESDGVVNVVVTKSGDFFEPIQGTLTTLQGSAGVSDYADGGYQFTILPGQQQTTVPISITDDTTVEDLREQFSVSLSLQPQQGLSSGNSQASVTIVDNDVGIGFSPALYQVDEDGRAGVVTFRVENRNPDREGQYRVQFTTIEGTAREGSDYESTTQEITFSQGEQFKTVEVPVIDDDAFEDTEEFSAQLTTTDIRVNIVERDATARILDDDDEVEISISPLAYEVDESAGFVDVIVQKIGGFSQPIFGSLTTVPGTASGSTDFDNGQYSFTIQPNEQETTVRIPITNDQVVEQLREQFSVSLSLQPQSGLNTGNSQASVTIVDDDVGIGFSPTLYQVDEDGRVVMFRVENRNPDREGQYRVQFTTIEGTAREGSDYESTTQEITFSQGEQFKTVEVPVIDDGVFENTEEFSAQLTTTDSRVNIVERDATARIADNDDEVEVSISSLGYVVDESAGFVNVIVQKSGAFTQPITGSLSTIPGTASGSTDFANGQYSFTIQPNEQETTVRIPITDDQVVEQLREQFSVSLSLQPQSGLNTGNSQASVTIVDDDVGIGFSPTLYQVDEDGRVVTFRVENRNPDREGQYRVQFTTIEGTAREGSDYESTTQEITFSQGEQFKTVEVPVIDDGVFENTEEFSAQLTTTDIRVNIVERDATARIADNDDEVEVSISSLGYEVDESTGFVNVIVQKSGAFTQPITGSLSTIPGTASGSTDFANGQYSFTIQPNEQETTVRIPITDDQVVEQLREQFSVSLSLQPQSGLNTGNSQASVTIVDDDVGIGFSPTLYQVDEDAGVVMFRVENRNPDREGQYRVQFTTIEGTAREGSDYESTTQEITFSQGEQFKTVEVPVIDDGVFENTEEFSAQLTTTDSRVNIVERDATARIADNDDEVEVSISSLGYEVDESAGFVNVIVQKNGAFTQPITGSLSTIPGTASGSTDFADGQYSFTIQPNEQETTVRIPITDDQVVEQLREQFSVSLSLQPQSGLNAGNSQASVTIVDDDGITISLEPATQTVTEGSAANFRIVATGDSDLPFSVTFMTVDGTARAPGDYRATSLTLMREQLVGDGFEITIPVDDDSVLEAREDFLGRLQLTQQSLDLGVVRLGQDEGEISIIDNDVVEIGFAPSVYSVDEDSESVVFFIENRNPDLQREVVVEFTTVQGTAIDGSDYIGKTQSITFEPGESFETVEVNIIDDNVYEGTQEFSAQLTTTDSGVNIFESDAVARITDDDAISIQFNPASYTVMEGGSTQLVVQKIGTAEEPVTVTLSTRVGSAGDSDFTPIINFPVTFGSSEFEKRITIQTNSDDIVEGVETLTAQLTPISDRVIITGDTADISIEETDNVIVEFQPDSYTVNEEDGAVSFIIVKRTPTTQDVTVQIFTMDGSATSPMDFESIFEEVTFSPEETVKIVMVPIQDDGVMEGVENFKASLTTVPGSTGVVIGQDEATISITENALISFTSPGYVIPEDGGSVLVCLTKSTETSQGFTVVLLAQPSLPVDAGDGKDFTGGEYRVQFPTSAGEQCVEIPIIDDSIALEGDEIFLVEFDSNQLPDDVKPGPVNFTTVTIIDDDEVRVSFESDSYLVTEDEGSVSVCVVREGDAAETFSIEVSTADLNPVEAEVGRDYNRVATTLTFGPDDERSCFVVPIVNDQINEGKEDFTAEIITSTLPRGVVVSTPEVTTITILDDDVVRVDFGFPTYTVPEGDGTVRLCLTTNIGSDEEITVVVSTARKTATPGVDYDSNPQAVVFPPSSGASEMCFEIAIRNDDVVESNEEFLVNLQIPGGTNADIGTIDSTCVQIIDDDEVNVFFERDSYPAPESGGPVTVCVKKEGEIAESFTVQVATSNLSPIEAEDGSDYGRVTTILTFEPNEDRQCFDIPITNDDINEGTETFSAEIISTSTDSGEGTRLPERTLISIVDDDVVTVDFGSPTYTVPENGDTVTVCLTTSSGSIEPIRVDVSTAPRTAEPGGDYSFSSQVVTIPASSEPSEFCFDIDIIDDDVVEQNEEFLISFQIPVGTDAVAGPTSTTTVTIEDNDEVNVSFERVTYIAPENSGPVSVCVIKVGQESQPLTITVATSELAPIEAEAGSDYSDVSMQLVFNPGQNRACFTVPIMDDQLNEGTERFVADITDVPSGVGIRNPSRTTISIEDDEVVTVDFGSPTYTVPEDGGSVSVCLTTNIGNDKPLTVMVSTASKSADAGQDYDGSSQDVTIPASVGPSETCFEIEIIDDSVKESDEEFLVSFQIPAGSDAQAGSVSSTCVLIRDNDEAPVVEFVEPAYTVAEDEGDVEVCLRIEGTIDRPTIVRLFATAETAEAGLDYIPGTVDTNLIGFQPAGDSVVCTSFRIIDDLLALEEDEKFVIDIDTGEGPVEIGPNNRTEVTIEDNDVVIIQPSTENVVVFEADGTAQICLMKDKDTSRPVEVTVVVRETSNQQNPATAGSDFSPMTATITFGELDRESCTDVEIINDNIGNEAPEVFEVNFLVSEENKNGTEIVNPVSMVTIIDDDTDATRVNDTVIADPLFTAPVLGGGQLCYEIHGKPDIILNLVSDKCTSVNAEYVAMDVAENGNIISSIGVRAIDSDGSCHNIEVRLGTSSPLESLVDGTLVSGVIELDGIRVRTRSDRVRIAVTNCELVDLVMWVMHMEMNGQNMLKFVISRGFNLAPTSHGLIGQFWNIPVTATLYNGPLRPEYEPFFDRDNLYLITVTPATGSGNVRSFLGEFHQLSWDRKSGPCYYVGSAQGGRTSERPENEPVIEGRYTDYRVEQLFDYEFKYSQFEESRCNSVA